MQDILCTQARGGMFTQFFMLQNVRLLIYSDFALFELRIVIYQRNKNQQTHSFYINVVI